MRRAVMLAVFILVLAVPAHAETHVGIVAGVGVSQLSIDQPEEGFSFDWRAAPAAGLVLDVNFGRNFGLSLEPMYVELGTKVFIASDDFLFSKDVNASFVGRALEVPLLGRLYIGHGSARPYLCGGPSFSHVFSWKAKGTDDEGQKVDEDASDILKKDDVGISAGTGIEFTRGRYRFLLEARYTWGLLEQNVDKDEGDPTIKNRGVRALAAFTVRLGGK